MAPGVTEVTVAELPPKQLNAFVGKDPITKALAARVDVSDVGTSDEHTETAEKILAIIKTILLTKLPGAQDKWDEGAPTFIATIRKFVEHGEVVKMCLPAFPWKSANKVEKVLGTLPDKAEEVALARLNGICTTIGQVYPPGAELLIISDGLVYNGTWNTKPDLIHYQPFASS